MASDDPQVQLEVGMAWRSADGYERTITRIENGRVYYIRVDPDGFQTYHDDIVKSFTVFISRQTPIIGVLHKMMVPRGL